MLIPQTKKEVKMESPVEILSRDIIKPSTPTPPHLKRHKLSLNPLMYVINITCYAPPTEKYENHSTITFARLKRSLSKALSLFYPLAGRLAPDESSIDCNDEGILFLEARCDCPLSSFLLDPIRYEAWRFVPSNSIPLSGELTVQSTYRSLTAGELVLMAIQVTIFNCGGVMIGVKGIHKIMDATSCGSFLKCWSDFARGDPVYNKPDFTTAATLFPPRTWAALLTPRAPVSFWKLDGNKIPTGCAVKVFRSSPQYVLTLQANARISDRLLNPTRLEAVSGLIWKHAMAAAATSKNTSYFGPSVMTHAVNIRPRIRPELPPTTFGNMVIHAFAYYKGQDKDDEAKISSSVPELSGLVSEVSRALASAKDAEYLNKLKGEKGSELIRVNKQKLADYREDDGNMNINRCASWSKVGLDYPDFGFLGKSVWSGHDGVLKNQIVFVMNQNQGIEVFLTLDKNEMECLQSNSEFLPICFSNVKGRPINHFFYFYLGNSQWYS